MNIAVFLPNWIGDVVMATPAVRALRQHYRCAHLVAVARPYVTDVLSGAPWFDATLPLQPTAGGLSVAWRLRRAQIDLAVLLPNSFRTALIAWLGGCRRRIGFRRYTRGRLLTDRLEPRRDGHGQLKPCPVIDDYNLLAQRAGCPWPGYRLELFTTPADEAAADRVWDRFVLAGAEVVCLNPGAAFGSAKHWPVESFARLACDLVERRGSRVLVLCGPGERALAADIAQRAGVASLASEPLSLGLTKALVRRCNLLVTTDSGPRHFAAAFERPVVTLFGPTHIAWTETYYPRALHLQKKVPCGPCQQRVCPTDHACMKLLTPAEVLIAAEQLLARPERKAS
jgi:heptosyltransferase-2